MKKNEFTVRTVFLMLMLSLISSFPLWSQQPGDVNGDEMITILDALMTAQHYVGYEVPGFNEELGDVNGDQLISIVDALIMAQIYAGLLPAPTPISLQNDFTLSGPDGNCQVYFELDTADGRPYYSVRYRNAVMLERSPLGLVRSDQNFDQNLQIQSLSVRQTIADSYQLLHGKRRDCTYNANKQVVSLINPAGRRMDIEFQVAENSVAFRYIFPDSNTGTQSVTSESTGFAFPSDTTVWMTPMDEAGTGFAGTNPSYEAHYVFGQPAGTNSPNAAGWCFPALYKIGNSGWVLISETLTDGSYCATRLAARASNRTYRIAFPQAGEYYSSSPVAPVISFPFYSPWRVIITGDSLKPIVESTAVTDLAEPEAVDSSFVTGGHSAWSWLQRKDSGTVYSVQQQFVDFADRMGWDYCLVDALWDTQIGYSSIQNLVNYANSRGIGIWLWYNSAGSWNTAPQTPRDVLTTSSSRRSEFSRLRQMGVKGIKVDFFGSDKQDCIQYYMDILIDAAEYGLMVNFHGATIPRGWERTYPNLMTAEAVRGMEMVTFSSYDGDRQPKQCAVLPFTRNVIGPMDFTPIIFNAKAGSSTRRTTLAFELALSVIFESGVQHFGLTPDEINNQPSYIVDYFNQLPGTWEDTVFIDGYPGEFSIIARRKGSRWWIGGINATSSTRNLSLNLSFLGGTFSGTVITDNSSSSGFTSTNFSNSSAGSFNVTLRPNGGFVIITS